MYRPSRSEKRCRIRFPHFEHRLRNEDEFVEKMTYIRENPVRKQLVKSSADYPYIIG
jgi:hypothetical protein